MTQGPATQIHLMNPLVAEVAIAGVKIPVPVVMQLTPTKGFHRCRADPQVVVDALGYIARPIDLADRLAWLVAEPSGEGRLADISLMHPGDRIADR